MKLGTLLSFLCVCSGQAAAAAEVNNPPAPTFADVRYGKHVRQTLDVWQARSERPAPVVVYFHGGGWNAQDKGDIHDHLDVRAFLSAGISVASVNYRFLSDANAARVTPPVKWPFEDASRAVQYLRAKANEWRLDTARFAATGVSAGGGIALWLGMHDDLADSTSADPIARESTRFYCVAVKAPVVTLDPRQAREWIPNAIFGAHAFGFANLSRPASFAPFLAARGTYLVDIRRYSPIEQASKDAPPIFLEFPNQDKPPVPGEPQTDPNHSAVSGLMLEKKLRSLGVPVELRYRGDGRSGSADVQEFLTRRLAGAGTRATPSGERVFFAFDDHSIPWQYNLHVTLVQAQKHPANPVLRRGPVGAPDHGHACLYGTVLKSGDKFRMWYLGMIEDRTVRGQAPGFWRPMCYAESTDGVHWTKPELGLVELHGSKRNNICLIEGEPYSLTRVDDYLSVLYEPEEPDPARRYKAVYIAHVPYDDIPGGMSKIGPKERRVCATICATSADGLRWKVVGDRPANAGGERFEASGLYHFGSFYYTSGQLLSPWAWRADGSKVGRVMLTYRSPDFEHWSPARAVSFLRPGQTTNPPLTGQQTHMGAGIWNRGNVLVGLYGMWQDPATPPPKGASHLLGTRIDLGLIVSNDGIHFREPVPDFKVIARGREGEWDSIALLQGHAFVNAGDRTMIWYSHWDTSGELRSMDIGLATLRRDGFSYLTPHVPDVPAQCVTATVPAQADPLPVFINVAGVTAAAPLAVELLDEGDQPLPDYSGANAAVISTDTLHGAVTWPRPHSNRLPRGHAVALRIRFPTGSAARLYALYVGADDAG